MKKIYISGPISGHSNAKANFDSAEAFLKAKGFETINPMSLDHSKASEWENYMRTDIKALMDADAIYMLRRSEKSDGAQLELLIAIKMKMPVFHEEYPWCLDKFVPEQRIEETIERAAQY